MKKIVTFVLTFVLIFGCVQMTWADTNPTVRVSSVQGKKGEKVDITVTMSGNPGMATFNFVLNFDEDVLTPVSISQGEALSAGSFVSNMQEPGVDLSALHTVTAVWSNPSNVTADGVLYTVTFQIIGDETTKASAVTLTYEEGNVCDQSYNDLTLNIENGMVTVLSDQKPATPEPSTEAPITPSPVPPTKEPGEQSGEIAVTPTPSPSAEMPSDNKPVAPKETPAPQNSTQGGSSAGKKAQSQVTSSSGQNTSAPKTADMGHIDLYMTLLLVSAAWIGVSIKKRCLEK